MLIPKEETVIVHIYYCPICDQYYSGQTGKERIECTVAHAPGSCCHYKEPEISSAEIAKIKDMIKEASRG